MSKRIIRMEKWNIHSQMKAKKEPIIKRDQFKVLLIQNNPDPDQGQDRRSQSTAWIC